MTNYNTNEQVYNVRENEALLTQVASVVCVLVQRGLFIAGFSVTNELLTIQYSGYNRNRPVWELDFFEHIFSNETILAEKDKVRGVFINSDKSLIVPEELYMEEAAKTWLGKIHFVEKSDIISNYPVNDENATFVHATPVNITELVKIHFRQAQVLPLAMYQLRNPNKRPLSMQLCVTSEQVCVAVHRAGQLQWHKVFGFSSAEDIAYSLNLFCKENNIDAAGLHVTCGALSASEYDRINELTQYFPGIRTNNGPINSVWHPAISLSQQLLSCV
jgi:hypothetical protein